MKVKITDLAKEMKLSKQTIYSWLKKGKFEGELIKNSWWVDKKSFEKFFLNRLNEKGAKSELKQKEDKKKTEKVKIDYKKIIQEKDKRIKQVENELRQGGLIYADTLFEKDKRIDELELQLTQASVTYDNAVEKHKTRIKKYEGVIEDMQHDYDLLDKENEELTRNLRNGERYFSGFDGSSGKIKHYELILKTVGNLVFGALDDGK